MWYACKRTCSHSVALSEPGLSHTRFETPTRPRSWNSPARRIADDSVVAESELDGRLLGEPCDARRVAEKVRRLQVDGVGKRFGEIVDPLLRDDDDRPRLLCEDRVPDRACVQFGVDRVCTALECLDHLGVEPTCRAPLQHGVGLGRPFRAMEDLGLVGEHDDTSAELDLLAGEPCGQPLAVPALMDLPDDARDGVTEADAAREAHARLAVRAHDVVQELRPRGEALEHAPHAPARRLASDLLAHRPQPFARARCVDARVGGNALELVRAEYLCAFVGERSAAHGMDEGGVEDVAPLGLTQAELLGDSLCGKAGSKRLLLRESPAEIGRERDDGEELRQPDVLRHARASLPGIAPFRGCRATIRAQAG